MEIIAAISTEQPWVWAIVQILIAAVIYYVVTWGIAKIGVPEPFNKVLMVLVVLMVVFFCVNALLTIAGRPLLR